ncbi:ComEC/Rec2 family competence protein [Pedobacter heparinus]|uniref:ComEC/Rec2 family competence protein n=1 Tax=Pedobacter heparinus TaxID=984 RepID=UPI00292F03F1|nr:ComEC/Rec2 family competence protein [Pedobacter heparinus]
MAHSLPINKAELAFLRLLIPFSVGIVAVYQWKAPGLTYWLTATVTLLFLLLFTINLSYKQLNFYRYKGIRGMMIHALLLLSGCLHSTLYNQSLNTDYYLFKKYKYLKVKIIDEPKIKPNLILFSAFVSKGYVTAHLQGGAEIHTARTASGKIRIALKPDTSNPTVLKYGDELIIPARTSEIERAELPSSFDFKSWLAMQNIYQQAYFKQAELIKLNSNAGHVLVKYALQLREKQIAIYRKIIKNDDAFAIAATLILGYRSDLTAETLDIYAKTGTIHALSVSGMHVGLIYLVLNWLLFFLDRNFVLKTLKILLILCLIWAYSLLTGFSPSVLRSAIMISVFILARLFDRSINSYNILAFAAFCLLLYHPFLIWDIGFQLSFLAVLGLIYLQPKIYGWLAVKNPLLNKIWSATAMSIAAQLATYPLSIYYFHQFPLFFLASNLFIMLPVAIIIYVGILILMFRLDGLGPLFEWLILFTNSGLNQIAGLPFSGISGIWINKTELLLLCLTLVCFTEALYRFKKRLLFTTAIAFFVLQSFLTYDKISTANQKKIIRFKLKKNYAIAWIKGNSAWLYTNLKPESREFSYAVKPALDQHKVKQLVIKFADVP